MWLQGFSPALDVPFQFLSLLGNEGFYLLLLPLVYWCLDKRTGARLCFLFLLSAYINSGAKELLNQPRPFEYDARVRPLVQAEGGGLPSGHTQHSVAVWGYLAMRLGRPWAWMGAVLLMIGIPLSRLYLGVHFPTDLLGGYILGAFLLLVFVRAAPRVEGMLTAWGPARQLAIAVILPGILILALPSGARSGLSAGATLMGIAVGMVIERRWVGFDSAGPFWKRVIRLVVGLSVALGVWVGLKAAFASLGPEPLFRFIRYSLLGLWTAVGAPWAFLRMGLAQVQQNDPPNAGPRPQPKQASAV